MNEAHARSTDPETSHLASQTVWEPTVVQQHIQSVLALHGPLTDTDLIWHYGNHAAEHNWPVVPTPQSIRSRRNELVEAGLVVFSGDFGETESGRKTRKWGLV